MERADRLIQKYLDDDATDAELAELEALLCSDPDAAAAFAEATRFAASLERRLAGESQAAPRLPLTASSAPARRRIPWRWAAAALVLLAVGAGGLLLYSVSRPSPKEYRLVSGQVHGDLAPGGRIEVTGDDPAVIELPGGVRAEMAAGSVFLLHVPDGDGQTVELLAGAATFDVPNGGAFRADTAAGSVHGAAARFAVELRPPEVARTGKRPEWLLSVTVSAGYAHVRQGDETQTLAAGQKQDFRTPAEPDLVGRVEAVWHRQSSRTVNGVEEAFEETRLRLVVLRGKAEKGARRTVRVGERAGAFRPATGMVVLVWLDPRQEDVAIHLERSASE
jgi:ferric-dicitrate binding protein FerR (iron transport regulator)